MRRWVLIGVAACLFVLVLPSSPVHLSYVYSDSMEPTIMEGDGYLVVPAGSVESGDILTFHSEERGEYVTHRVVEVTDDGFVTRGDNNPSTDQSAGYPLVSNADVLGKVATLGDQPVVLPRLGVVMATIQTHWRLATGALVLLFGISGGTTRTRDVVRFRSLLIPLVVMAIVGTSAALVFGAPTASMTFTATDAGETGGISIPIGEPATRTLDADFGVHPGYTHQFTETNGATLVAIERTDWTDELHVRIPAQAELRPHQVTVHVYRYPAILPYGVVAPLQAIHPAIAATATMSVIIGSMYLLTWVFIDGKALLQSRSRRRPLGRIFK